MIGVSGVLMYAVMYLNTYQLGHVFFSETRLYMTLLMVATMAVVMFYFMKSMYRNNAINVLILLGSIILFATSLFLVRSQVLVDDVDWLEGMIPHHSIAILTSERAQLSDPRVQELAQEIIEAQKREIDEMKALINDIKNEN
jgi:CDP-diglyceride synthetase